MKAGKAELELCSGKQIPKVAQSGRLEEWIKCPVDACETGVRMTQLGWESCGDELTVAQPGSWDCGPSTASLRGKGCRGTAELRLNTLLKRRR